MGTRLSRQQILGIGAASLAGGVAWPAEGRAAMHSASTPYRPAVSPGTSGGSRAYWDKTYSGGPIDVAPLPSGLPGEHYRPVVVPDGAALPFKVVEGVKVLHLIAGEVDHAFDSGLRARCWGFNGRVNGTCHMTHHVMNHGTRLPSYDKDPGWYRHPPGTVALRASDADLARDGIDVNAPTADGGRSVAPPPTGRADHAEWWPPATDIRRESTIVEPQPVPA